MRRAAALLALLLLPLGSSLAQAPETVIIELEMVDEGDASFFRVPGAAERNPVLVVPPGATVTLRVHNAGTRVHDLFLENPISRATPCCQAPGDNATLTFTAPETPVDVTYRSTQPLDDAMRGTLRVAQAAPRLRMLEPQEDANVARTVEIEVAVEGFDLVPPDGTNATGRGHIAYTLDGAPAGPDANTTATRYRVGALAPGFHVLRAELVDGTGSPLAPPVFAEATVYVAPDAPTEPTATPTPAAEPDAPMDERSPIPAPGVLTLLALAALAAARRRA